MSLFLHLHFQIWLLSIASNLETKHNKIKTKHNRVELVCDLSAAGYKKEVTCLLFSFLLEDDLTANEEYI